MIHTFEVRLTLSRENYNICKNKLDEYCKKHHIKYFSNRGAYIKKDEKKYVSYKCRYDITDGLTIYVRQSIGEFTHLWLEIRVNLVDLLYDKNPYRIIYDSGELACGVNVFEGYLNSIGLALVLDDFRTSRCDYAWDLKLSSKEQVAIYMKLLKKYNSIGDYIEWSYWCGVGHCRKFPKTSVYLTCNNRKINFYDKRSHVEDIRIKYPGVLSEIEDEDIIRFEIQNDIGAIETMKNTYRLESKTPSLYLTETMSDIELTKYVKKLYGTGDYYSFEEAYIRIVRSSYRSRAKEIMIELIQSTARKAIHVVKKEWIGDGMSIRDFKRILNKFDDIGVIPVCIPKVEGYKRIPGPYTYVTSKISNLEWIK